MSDAALRRMMAPTGKLRAGLNMANPLLITGEDADGTPTGVAPDIAAAVAERLGVPLTLLPYPAPTELVAAVGEWDMCFVGSEPARAEQISFTEAYVEIEATYMVPPGSALTSIDDVDKPGVRIACMSGSAYGLFLARSLQHAELVWAEGIEGSYQLFEESQGTDAPLDALAGLRTRLDEDAARMPGAEVLAGGFSSVKQAAGVPRKPGFEAAGRSSRGSSRRPRRAAASRSLSTSTK